MYKTVGNACGDENAIGVRMIANADWIILSCLFRDRITSTGSVSSSPLLPSSSIATEKAFVISTAN